MKKLKLLFFAISFILFSACNNADDPVDESMYFDQDDNCEDHPLKLGICGDIDGRILVISGKSYTYSFNTFNKLIPDKIEWSTSNSDIVIVEGIGTTTATFKFSEKFTSGKIIATVYLLNRIDGRPAGDLKVIQEVSKIE